MRIPSGSTDKYLYFVAVDATDYVTRETGLSSFTVARSRNGAADAAYTTPTVTEIDATAMPGVYALLLDEDTTLGAGVDSEEVCVHITHTGMAPVTRTFELYRQKITAGETLTVGSGIASADVVEWLGTAPATPTTAGVPEVDLTHIAGAAVSTSTAQLGVNVVNAAGTAWASGSLTSGVFAAGAITASAIAADAIGASELAADAVAEIADAVWDELQSGHVSAGSFGEIATEIASILVDTAEIGAAGAGLTEAGGTGDQLTGIPWNAAWDAEVQSEVTDGLNAYDPPTNTEMVAAFTEIKGATWATTDTLEAIRDRGDAAWITATGFSTLDAAGVRTAVGLASANLDTQLADIPTTAEFDARTLASASYATATAQTTAQNDLDILTGADGATLATSQPNYAPAVSGDIPSANTNADALLDRADAIETGLTLRGALRLNTAALAGKVSGAGSGTEVFRNAVADSKARITSTVDADGNRTAVTADAT